MNRYRIVRVLGRVGLGVVAITLFGWVVMSLWNWLIPPLTGWHTLGFAQALGLLVLSRLLFGRFGRRGWGPGRGRRWSHLSAEEREQLRTQFGGRCGLRERPADQPS
jgi:hypothetical protein